MKIKVIKSGFKILWLLEAVLYIAIPFSVTSIQRLCYYSFYIINIVLFLYTIVNIQRNRIRLKKNNFKSLIIIILILVSLLISCILNPEKFTFDVHFSAIMNYLGLIFSIFYVFFIDLDDTTIKEICGINVFIGILFCLLSFSSYAYTHEKLTTFLNLGYSNPNSTAIYIFLTISIILSFFEYIKSKKVKFFLLILIVYLIYLIFLTESRTCMVVAIALVIYSFWPFNTNIERTWVIISLIIPIFFLFLYSYLYENNYFIDLVIMGKEFYSGREGYFVEVLNDLKNYLFFGNFGMYHLTNTHNGPLSVLASLGISGLIFLYSYLYNSIKILLNSKSKTSKMAIVSILVLLVQSSSEAAILVGGANFTVPIATLFLVAKANKGVEL